jgi:phage major head subunit gpT-like protein
VEINFPNLQTLNDGVSLAYNTAFWEAESVRQRYTFEAPSSGPEEVYPRLDLIAGLREWLGARVIERLSLTTFAIQNKTFEKTIAISRENIEDDKYGFLAPAASQLGQNAAHLPDLLITSLLTGGHTAPTYDNQNFFDVAHPTYDQNGNPTTVANYQVASGTDTNGAPWFLIDTTKVLRPFIWQMRRPFKIVPMVALDNPYVFQNNEFVWGVDGRGNAGYGLWHLAAMSTAPLTAAYFGALRAQMAAVRRPDGTPMGIRPTILVHGPSNKGPAVALANGEFILSTGTSPTVAYQPNPWRGTFEPVENVWLT